MRSNQLVTISTGWRSQSPSAGLGFRRFKYPSSLGLHDHTPNRCRPWESKSRLPHACRPFMDFGITDRWSRAYAHVHFGKRKKQREEEKPKRWDGTLVEREYTFLMSCVNVQLEMSQDAASPDGINVSSTPDRDQSSSTQQ